MEETWQKRSSSSYILTDRAWIGRTLPKTVQLAASTSISSHWICSSPLFQTWFLWASLRWTTQIIVIWKKWKLLWSIVAKKNMKIDTTSMKNTSCLFVPTDLAREGLPDLKSSYWTQLLTIDILAVQIKLLEDITRKMRHANFLLERQKPKTLENLLL